MSTKVFVGNLDFNTTDQVLKDAFAHCGPVKRGIIITRGRRPLGYGFVEFDSPEVALASVEKMNKVELFGRQINVEVAKDHPKDFQWKNVNTETGGGKETGPAPRRRRRVHANDLVGEDEVPAPNPTPTRAPLEDTFTGDAPRSTPNTRRRRKPKKVRPITEKILSKTTLFVANLPFSVDDEKLKSIFADTNVKSARVVRTRNGRSRGYGFVEFENEKDQITAMQTKNDIDVEGPHGSRKISVTISNSVSPPEEIPAPGTTSPATFNPEGTPAHVKAGYTASGGTHSPAKLNPEGTPTHVKAGFTASGGTHSPATSIREASPAHGKAGYTATGGTPSSATPIREASPAHGKAGYTATGGTPSSATPIREATPAHVKTVYTATGGTPLPTTPNREASPAHFKAGHAAPGGTPLPTTPNREASPAHFKAGHASPGGSTTGHQKS
jgi:RNA recognition motif-containing protein